MNKKIVILLLTIIIIVSSYTYVNSAGDDTLTVWGRLFIKDNGLFTLNPNMDSQFAIILCEFDKNNGPYYNFDKKDGFKPELPNNNNIYCEMISDKEFGYAANDKEFEFKNVPTDKNLYLTFFEKLPGTNYEKWQILGQSLYYFEYPKYTPLTKVRNLNFAGYTGDFTINYLQNFPDVEVEFGNPRRK